MRAAHAIEPRRSGPWLALALSCIVHLWLVWAWRHAGWPPIKSPLQPQRSSHLPLQLRLIPFSIPAAVLEHSVPAASSHSAAAQRRRDRTVSLPAALQSVSAAALEAVDPSPLQPGSGHRGDLAESALAGIGKIDRDLRQAAPARPGLLQTPVSTPATRLAQGIAAAYIPTSTAMEDVTMADGRRYTRITGPFGTKCAWSRDPGISAITATVFDTALRTTSCPK